MLRAAIGAAGLLLAACAPKQGAVVYAVARDPQGEVPLTLDVRVPGGAGPHPGVLVLHSGGWRAGHLWEWDIPAQVEALAEAGFVVVTAEYRLTADRGPGGAVRWPWPAQISDARCAVRWMRAHAEALSLDPARIGATGWSTGGHLALLLGVAPEARDLDDGQCPIDGPASVQAVASRAGPADLVAMVGETVDAGREMLGALVDAEPVEPSALAVASPLHRLGPAPAPILQQQGDADAIVPPLLAARLDGRLTERGHPAWLETYPGVGHLWWGEALEEARAEVVAFFERELGGG